MNSLPQKNMENEGFSPSLSVSAIDIAAEGVRCFADVAEQLGTVRSALNSVVSQLDDYIVLASPERDVETHFTSFLTSVETTIETLERNTDDRSEMQFRSHLRAASRELQDIERAGRSLSAVAMISRATVGSFGVTFLNGYLEEITAIANRVRSDMQQVSVGLETVSNGRFTLNELYKTAQKTLGDLKVGVVSVEADYAQWHKNETDTAMSISRKAGGLARLGRDQMKTLIETVQFADRLAQRVDHLGTILKYRDVGGVSHLAAAHMGAIADAMRNCAKQTSECAVQLKKCAGEVNELFMAGDIANAVRQSIVQKEYAATKAAQDVSAVQELLSVTERNLKQSQVAIADVEYRFGDLEKSARQVSSASINSALLAARAGDAKAALTTLAAEVTAISATILNSTKKCSQTIQTLSRGEMGLHVACEAQFGNLETAYIDFKKFTDSGSGRLVSLKDLCSRANRENEGLQAAVVDLRGAMQIVEDLAAALDREKHDLQSKDEREKPTKGDALSEIWSIYTMAEERIVHVELFPEFEEKYSQKSDDDEELNVDDMLF